MLYCILKRACSKVVFLFNQVFDKDLHLMCKAKHGYPVS